MSMQSVLSIRKEALSDTPNSNVRHERTSILWVVWKRSVWRKPKRQVLDKLNEWVTQTQPTPTLSQCLPLTPQWTPYNGRKLGKKPWARTHRWLCMLCWHPPLQVDGSSITAPIRTVVKANLLSRQNFNQCVWLFLFSGLRVNQE